MVLLLLFISIKIYILKNIGSYIICFIVIFLSKKKICICLFKHDNGCVRFTIIYKVILITYRYNLHFNGEYWTINILLFCFTINYQRWLKIIWKNQNVYTSHLQLWKLLFYYKTTKLYYWNNFYMFYIFFVLLLHPLKYFIIISIKHIYIYIY